METACYGESAFFSSIKEYPNNVSQLKDKNEEKTIVASAESTSTPSWTKDQSNLEEILEMALQLLSEKKEEKIPLKPAEVVVVEPVVNIHQVDEQRYKELTGQYNANGHPAADPIPSTFIPHAEQMLPLDEEEVTHEELEAVMFHMNIPTMPLVGHRAMWADNVPKELAEHGIAFLLKRYHKTGPTKNLKSFTHQFFAAITDERKRLVNWRSVYLVTHYMRLFSSGACYNIEDDLFSERFGTTEYNLDNWQRKREHAIRLLAISQLTGDSLGAVFTLDAFLRYKRSVTEADYCITYQNRAFVFIDFLDDDNKAHTCWIDIALNSEEALKLDKNDAYYDSPCCATCLKHHGDTKLSYCSRCKSIQYCSTKCRKLDYRKHNPLCEAKRRGAK